MVSFRRVPYTRDGRSLSAVAPIHTTGGYQGHSPIISSVAPAHTTDGPHKTEYSHRHLADIEARPARRPFTYEELQLFFDTADKMARTIQASGRKGALSAYRDAQFFKTVYAYGLRRREAIMLDTTDLHHNP